MTTNTPNRKAPIRDIAAAVIGNALEWYDFFIFAFMATIITGVFTSGSDEHKELVKILGIYGVGFLMRPIGGIFFGLMADRVGRKRALSLVIILMSISMLLLTLAPSYATAGTAAIAILVVSRLIQGFATGGEFGTSTSLLVELAPKNQKGFYGSWQLSSQMLAVFLAASAGFAVSKAFSPEEIKAFAWRIPFALGLLIIPVAWYIRKHMQESHEFESVKNHSEGSSLSTLFKHYRLELLVSIGILAAGTTATYTIISYVVTYAKTFLKLDGDAAFLVQAASALWMVVLIPIVGRFSDKFGVLGRPKILLGAFLPYLLILIPAYQWLLLNPSIERLWALQLLLCTLIAVAFGVLSTVLTELFPTQVRASGISIGYNLGVLIFGAAAQPIVTELISRTKNPMIPAYYVVSCTIVGVIALAVLIWRNGKNPQKVLNTNA
ncbi:MFS transporter [Formosimonas limnophila]|uniref:MFS transporter n=1 Tax=Formosimonas limnophila TaxID=1384487 RepID=A0A8J3FYG8_9BURK|nr:MFS transporter [Formosimonas limnophila]GHA73223.1 MFS transporter [Formosimonas limnophila]